MQFSLVEMWHTMGMLAKFVVVVLAIMSMFSLGVIAERFFTFLRAQRQSVAYIVSLRAFFTGRRLREAAGVAGGHHRLRPAGRDPGGLDVQLLHEPRRQLRRRHERRIVGAGRLHPQGGPPGAPVAWDFPANAAAVARSTRAPSPVPRKGCGPRS